MGFGEALLAIMAVTFLLSALLHAFLRRRRPWVLGALAVLHTFTFVAVDPSVATDERFYILLLMTLGTGVFATIAGVVAGLALQALQRALDL